jgi:CHAT domain-containing protein/tetratricopeptide (TPR) repeat protein
LFRLIDARLRAVSKLEGKERVDRLRMAALACNTHHELHGDAESAHRALRFAQDAIRTVDAAAPAIERVQVLDTLASVLFRRGLGRDDRVLERAQLLFARALALINRRIDPAAWCTAANSLGAVHVARAQLSGSRTHRKEAIKLFGEIRATALRGGLLQAWADASKNQLLEEQRDAEERHDVPGLIRVERGARRTLDTLRRRRAAVDLSELRHFQAITLCKIADLRYRRRLLEEARRLWEENLTAWPRERAEWRWAAYVNSLAVVEMTIGEKESSAAAFERALELLSQVADFPSSRRRRRGGAKPPWNPRSAPQNYSYALSNAVGVRDKLSMLRKSRKPIDDMVEDTEALLADGTITDAALVALAQRGRVRAEIALARLSGRPSDLDRTEELAAKALDALRRANETYGIVDVLTSLADGMKSLARPPDAIRRLERAEGYARKAVEEMRPARGSEAYVAAWRLLMEIRLRLAAWRGRVPRVHAILAKVRRCRRRLGKAVSRQQAEHLDAVILDCRSVIARLEKRPRGYAALARRLRVSGDPGGLAASAPLVSRLALGHALSRAGDTAGAIATWTDAQRLLWAEIARTGASEMAAAVTCGVGETGHALTTGEGLSLADELAMALLLRGRRGDVERAVTAIERGRAILPTTGRLQIPEVAKAQEQLRRAEARLAEQTGTVFTRKRGGRRLAVAGEKVAALRAALTAKTSLALGMPSVDCAAVVRTLPHDAAVAVLVVAERDGGVILLGRDARGRQCANGLVLRGLGRLAFDSLLLGRIGKTDGLIAAIESIRDLGEQAKRHELLSAVDRFSRRLAACQTMLRPLLLDPLAREIGRTLGPHIQRLCWLVPSALWPLPLHALTPTVGQLPPVQSYGRTVNEVVALRQRASAPRSSSRVLIVNDPLDNMETLPVERLQAANKALRGPSLRGRQAASRAILSKLRNAGLFVFHGHGQFVAGDHDQTGLRVSSVRRRGRGVVESVPHEILSINAMRELAVSPRRLAILSACDVGSVDLHATQEDFAGLPSELLESGFASVIAATWPVEQRATVELMALLLERLGEDGRDPARALSAAQSALRKFPRPAGERADHAAPYWWAGFRTIGF